MARKNEQGESAAAEAAAAADEVVDAGSIVALNDEVTMGRLREDVASQPPAGASPPHSLAVARGRAAGTPGQEANRLEPPWDGTAEVDRTHEDLAWFRRCVSYLSELMEEAGARSRGRGPHAGRLWLCRNALEAAYFQARQGEHEALHHQIAR